MEGIEEQGRVLNRLRRPSAAARPAAVLAASVSQPASRARVSAPASPTRVAPPVPASPLALAPAPSTPSGVSVESGPGPNAGMVAGWVAALARMGHGVGDAELINQLRVLEDLKSAAAAAQARAAVVFDASQRRAQTAAGVPAARLGQGIAAQVALARRESPARGDRLLGTAKALVAEMPHTLTALEHGKLNEWRATIMVRETACLRLEDRRAVDAELAADTGALDGVGDQGLAALARGAAYRLDPASALARARRAVSERRVSCRPGPGHHDLPDRVAARRRRRRRVRGPDPARRRPAQRRGRTVQVPADGRQPRRTRHRQPRRSQQHRNPTRHDRPHPAPGRQRTRPAARLRHRPRPLGPQPHPPRPPRAKGAKRAWRPGWQPGQQGGVGGRGVRGNRAAGRWPGGGLQVGSMGVAGVGAPALHGPGDGAARSGWTPGPGSCRRVCAGSSPPGTEPAADPTATHPSGTQTTSCPGAPATTPAKPTPRACAKPATRPRKPPAGQPARGPARGIPWKPEPPPATPTTPPHHPYPAHG